MALFLLRYAEMGLKSEKVRRRFQHALIENIENHFLKLRKECLVSWDRGRIFVMTGSAETARIVLSHTFGIVSFSEVIETKPEIESILKGLIDIGSTKLATGSTFAIRARRSGQQHFTSIELAKLAGESVLNHFSGLNLKVDLDNPDVELFIDAREKGTYLFSEVEMGPGGLPLGTQGTVLCPVAVEDDLLSAWMMMRRGCRVIVSASDAEFASGLEKWDPGLTILPLAAEGELSSLARQHGCRGIALGLSYGEIARLKRHGDGIAYFYPLTGLTADEREKLLAKVL